MNGHIPSKEARQHMYDIAVDYLKDTSVSIREEAIPEDIYLCALADFLMLSVLAYSAQCGDAETGARRMMDRLDTLITQYCHRGQVIDGEAETLH